MIATARAAPQSRPADRPRRPARQTGARVRPPLGGGAALPASAPLEDAIAAFGCGAAVGAGGITIDAPEIAENGNAVPVSVSAQGAVAIVLLGGGSPEMVTRVSFGPAAGAQTYAARVRVARTLDVLALVRLADGSVIEARGGQDHDRGLRLPMAY